MKAKPILKRWAVLPGIPAILLVIGLYTPTSRASSVPLCAETGFEQAGESGSAVVGSSASDGMGDTATTTPNSVTATSSNASSGASITYCFDVSATADAPATSVYVDIAASATASAAGGGPSALALVDIGGFDNLSGVVAYDSTDTPEEATDDQYLLAVGAEYDLVVTASASGAGEGGATAEADPYIYVDQTLNADPGDYSIDVSAGVSNVPLTPPPANAPEPGSAGLLGVGLLGIVFAGRKRLIA